MSTKKFNTVDDSVSLFVERRESSMFVIEVCIPKAGIFTYEIDNTVRDYVYPSFPFEGFTGHTGIILLFSLTGLLFFYLRDSLTVFFICSGEVN